MIICCFILLSVRLAKIIFVNLFYYLGYFCYYSWVQLHFLVLFMGPINHYTISANFYLYLQYSQQKVFSFSKISGSQTDPNSLKLRFLGENIIFILFQAFGLLSLCYYVLCVVLLLPNDCCWSMKN